MITTQKEYVERAVAEMKLCSVSVQSERMTFDSAIFNHYETLPVKEIYLYSMKIPYENWEELKNTEDVITEANPYIEDIVSQYSASRVKFQLISFIFTMFFGIYFVFKIASPGKMPKKQFVVTSIVNSILYVFGIILLLVSFPRSVTLLSALSSGVLFVVCITVALINYRVSKWQGK